MAVKLDDRSRGGAASAFASGAPRPGDTLPPTPLAALLAAGGADLIVLSTDEQLIDTVTRASGDQLPVWSVGSWTELQTAVSVARRAVVLVDAELLGSTTGARIAELDACSHKVVTLVAGDRAVAERLMGLLSERKVHRLLIKPPALGITRLLIDSAVGRCLKLADEGEREAATLIEQARAPVQRRRAATPFWVIATAGSALVAGVVVIASVSTWWRSDRQSEALQVQGATDEVAIVAMAARPDEEAARGSDDIDAQADLASPDEPLAILAALPAASVAEQQPDSIVADLYAEAETALLDNAYDRAARALADVRRADPTSSRLAFLEAQLERARQPASQPQQVAAEPSPTAAAANSELASLVTIARARMQRGELLDPAGDSAFEYVNRAQRLAPQHPDVIAVRDELAFVLLGGARGALAASDLAKASVHARRAASLEADATAIAELDAELGAAWAAFTESMQERIGAALAAHDWTRAEAGLATLADAPNGAAAGEPLRARLELARLEANYLAVAAPAGELELVERVAPDYPAEAARNGTEGWVDVEFVVDVTGQTRDFEVVAAEPQGQFEEAALAALAKYRYRPFTHEGRPFARRLRLRMRFTLE
jgi:protein TonB